MPTAPVILITGASSGFGAATARQFAKIGYRVVMAARRMDRLQALASEISSKGAQALPIQTDVAQLTNIHNLVQISLEHFGQIDVLFNNAGFGNMGWLERLNPIDDIQQQIQVNLVGLIQLTRVVLPHMISRRSGHIINMGSIASMVATPTYSIYAASKFGVRGFTDALRREVGIYNINVSGIYPAGAETEFGSHADIRRKTGVTTPPALRLSSDQVAQAVLNLVKRPRRALIIPWYMRTIIWLNMFLPGLLDWAVEQYFVRPERNAA